MKHGILKLVAVVLMASACVTANAQVPDLVYLRFNEGTGTTTLDRAVPGIGALPTVPSTAWDSTTQFLGAAALKLLPTLTAGNNCKLNVQTSISGSWTIEFWARDFEQTSSTRYILGDNTATFYCYRTGLSPATLVMGGTNMTTLSVPSALTFQAWTHIAYVYDTTTGLLSLYLNGVLAGSIAQVNNPISINGTATTGLSIGGYGTSTQFVGGLDEFRMWGSARTAGELIANMNIQLTALTDDVAVVSVDSPVSATGCATLTSTETVSFTLRNLGTNSIIPGTLFSADYVIDGGTPVTEFFTNTNTLNAGDTEAFTFATPANLLAFGPHTVDVTVAYIGDLYAPNDTKSLTVYSGGIGSVSTFPYLENFDGAIAQNSTTPPLGWKQDTTDGTGTDSDWYMHTGNTSSSNTGPIQGDHTSGSGYYAYVEDSTGNFAQVNLISPCLDLSLLNNPRLLFYMFSFNGNPSGSTTQENFLSVDVISYPGGTVTMDVFGPQGDLGTSATQAGAQWAAQSVDLSAFLFQTIEIRFRGTSNNSGAGNTFYHDICIDDVSVFDLVVGNGQAGQPGVAVLDINNAQNKFFGAGNAYSGDPGPFVASGTAGGPMTFTLAGESNQPAILLVGPVNVLAASYPNIGQFDIGGPLDPFGIPTQLQVIGDGFNPTSLIDALMNTGNTGTTVLSFQVPPLPLGLLGGFQAAFATSNGFFFAMANMVEFTVN